MMRLINLIMLHVQCLQTNAILIGIVLKVLFIYPANSIQCKQYKTGCACQLASQNGGIIDLSSVANRNGEAAFQVKDTNESHVQVQFNPCYGFTNKNSNGICDDVSVCKIENNDKFKCLGRQDSVQFLYDDSHSQVYLQYEEGSIITKVFLKCHLYNKQSILEDLYSLNSTLYQMTLRSPCACPNGCLHTTLGIGSILCIIFSSGVLAYFVVGILYRRTVYELKGWEAVPNHEFWQDLPALIKDGYMFFISPCLGNRVEYRRYERL